MPSSKEAAPDDFNKDQQLETATSDVLGADLATLGCLSLPQSLSYTFIQLVMVENLKLAVNISALSVTVSEI